MTRRQITTSPVYQHILSQNDARRFSLLSGPVAAIIADKFGCRINIYDGNTLPEFKQLYVPGDVIIHISDPATKEPLIAMLMPIEEDREFPNTEPDSFGNEDEERAMKNPEYADYDYWHITPITE